LDSGGASSEAQHKILIIIKTIYSSETSFHPNITSTEAAVFSQNKFKGYVYSSNNCCVGTLFATVNTWYGLTISKETCMI
jgi:hypothetical protein